MKRNNSKGRLKTTCTLAVMISNDVKCWWKIKHCTIFKALIKICEINQNFSLNSTNLAFIVQLIYITLEKLLLLPCKN